MEWSKLSMAERARYIQLGVKSGVTSLDTIRDTYNSYAEGGYTENTVYRNKNSGDLFIYTNGTKTPVTYSNGAYVTKEGKRYRPSTIEGQHKANRNITNEQVVDSYLSNVVYTMENPTSKGLTRNGWTKYEDRDADGNTHINIGPGIESHSDVGATIDYGSSYSTESLNTKLRPDLLKKMEGIMDDLHSKYGEDADTMSIGNRLILLDIAHNVRPRGSKRKNMPSAWPSLVSGMMSGDTDKAKSNTNSGSTRRQTMRNDLLWRNFIDKSTVTNK